MEVWFEELRYPMGSPQPDTLVFRVSGFSTGQRYRLLLRHLQASEDIFWTEISRDPFKNSILVPLAGLEDKPDQDTSGAE